jgi:hypothetical protein
MRADHDEPFLADLRTIRGRVTDDFSSLCEFMGVTEREVLCGQTIVAAVHNLDARGEAYSIRDAGVFSVVGGGLIDNKSAYVYLLNDGYLEEDDRGGQVVIFPTRKLLDALLRFFSLNKS